MSKLIYVDRLKKDILDLPNCYNGFSDTYDKACIIGVIDEQPTIEPEDRCGECDAWNQYKNYSRRSQWIPCNWHKDTENLPDECESVLICIKDKIGTFVDVSYRTDYNRWERYGRNINVVAWMPLPEPYRKDGD